MSDRSQILSLPYIQPAQAQKHVTHNEALHQLDVVVQLAVVDASLSVPPASPDTAARYIVGPAPTGDWVDHEHDVALYVQGAWAFFTPVPGWHADVLSTGKTIRFDGTGWGPPVQDALQNLEQLGINTTADETNRLSVSSDATLLNNAGGGHQLKLNKAGAGDTASLLFQTGFSGRAEMGIAGGDNFSIKVSPDGASFLEGMIIDAQTGKASFPNGSPNFRQRLTSNLDYYVRPGGSDTNTGLANTAAGAFATVQHAVNTMMALDCGIFNVTINVAAGTYPEAVTVSGLVQGSGTYKLLGDPATPSTVKLRRILCQKSTLIFIEGFEFTDDKGVDVQSRAQVTLRSARFSGAGDALSIRDGFLDCKFTTLSLASSITTIATMYNYANLSAFGADFVLDDNIDWGPSGAFFMQSFCLAWLQSAQFTGATASCVNRRYNIGLNSILNTAGQNATFIPGTLNGVAGTGGQYA